MDAKSWVEGTTHSFFQLTTLNRKQIVYFVDHSSYVQETTSNFIQVLVVQYIA